MLNEFYREKKIYLQSLGILIAISGIFLSIQPPDNSTAQIALMNIQYCCFNLIRASIFFLIIQIFIFINRDDMKMNVSDFIMFCSVSIFLGSIYIILQENIGIYLKSLYSNIDKNEFINEKLRYLNAIAIIAYCMLIFFYYNKQLFKKIKFIPVVLHSIIFLFFLSSVQTFFKIYILDIKVNILNFISAFYSVIGIKGYIFLIHLFSAIFIELNFRRQKQHVLKS
jgi:hypothetical protein